MKRLHKILIGISVVGVLVALSFLPVIMNTISHNQGREGIWIRDEYLCSRVLVGDSWTLGESTSVDIFCKVDEMLGFFWETKDQPFHIGIYINSRSHNAAWLLDTNTGEHNYQIYDTELYPITIHNISKDYNGSLDMLIILYDPYYPPINPFD